jgi:hypothetical protein
MKSAYVSGSDHAMTADELTQVLADECLQQRANAVAMPSGHQTEPFHCVGIGRGRRAWRRHTAI